MVRGADVPIFTQPSRKQNILTEFGTITMDDFHAHVEIYIYICDKESQNSILIYNCIADFIAPDLKKPLILKSVLSEYCCK
jgi:hypothetical protein